MKNNKTKKGFFFTFKFNSTQRHLVVMSVRMLGWSAALHAGIRARFFFNSLCLYNRRQHSGKGRLKLILYPF